MVQSYPFLLIYLISPRNGVQSLDFGNSNLSSPNKPAISLELHSDIPKSDSYSQRQMLGGRVHVTAAIL